MNSRRRLRLKPMKRLVETSGRAALEGPLVAAIRMKPLRGVLLLAMAAASACSNESRLPESPVSPCVVSTTLSENSFGPEGTSATATVTTRTGCAWNVTADTWITPAVVSGNGAGTFVVTIAPNAEGATRTGALVVAGQRLELAQSGCAVKLTSELEEFDDTGGVRDVSVETTSACRWAVETLEPWVKVEPTSGTGPATLQIRVPENPGTTLRTATVRVNGPTVSVRQAGEPVAPRPPTPAVACDYRVDPVEALISPLGGTGAVNITAPAGCGWTASVATNQVSLSAGSGTGSARLDYTVQKTSRAHIGSDRYAIAIRWPTPTAGQNVWLTQLPNCSILFVHPSDPSIRSAVETVTIPASGATSHLWVLADSGLSCSWTASSDAAWIALRNAGKLNKGDGGITFTVGANDTGRERSGHILAGEKFLKVIQPAR